MQFTVTSSEKEQIKNFCRIENHKTISEFMRRLVFDYMRKQLNPEIFLLEGHRSLNSLNFKKIIDYNKEILRNQETFLQREDSIEQMREILLRLYETAEKNSLLGEKEIITQLLKENNSLSLRQIQDETNIPDNIIFKIISDMNFFKITPAGRFKLR